MSLRKFVGVALPSFVKTQVIRAESVSKAISEDTHLRRESAPLRADLQASTVLLADRKALLARMPKGGVAAEVGVLVGDYSSEILRAATPAKLHLLDWWLIEKNMHAVRRRFADEIQASRVQLHQGESPTMLAKFPDNYFDWVYVDAAHDYYGVRSDLAALRPKMKRGGYVAGHDYIRWDVTLGGVARYGVIEAVNEFANATNSRLAYLTNEPDRYISYALHLPG